MAKQTVYIPVEIETATEIDAEQAQEIANSIVSQVNEDFYNRDNVFDNASEVTGDYDTLVDFKVKYPVAPNDFCPIA